MKSLLRTAACLLALGMTMQTAAQGCVGDIVVDGKVDGRDLGMLLANWGPRTIVPASIASDLDRSGSIDGADLGAMLMNWGALAPVCWATVIQEQPDPLVVTNPALRAAIEATGLPWRVRDARTGIEMLLVPPGTFQMGCVIGSDVYGCLEGEVPVHDVTLTNPFYLGRYEVTQAQWAATFGGHPSAFRFPSAEVPAAEVPNRPVERLTWNVATEYLTANGLRFPTEAEWEYACKAGTQTPFYDGTTTDILVGNIAWFVGNSGTQTRPVGGKPANALGFHDMLGNVMEWVSDIYSPYSPDPQINPAGPPTGFNHPLRGGAWQSGAFLVRSYGRALISAGTSSPEAGLRVARNP